MTIIIIIITANDATAPSSQFVDYVHDFRLLRHKVSSKKGILGQLTVSVHLSDWHCLMVLPDKRRRKTYTIMPCLTTRHLHQEVNKRWQDLLITFKINGISLIVYFLLQWPFHNVKTPFFFNGISLMYHLHRELKDAMYSNVCYSLLKLKSQI